MTSHHQHDDNRHIDDDNRHIDDDNRLPHDDNRLPHDDNRLLHDDNCLFKLDDSSTPITCTMMCHIQHDEMPYPIWWQPPLLRW